jgi:carbon monoxide dehydrogenase subunit G
MQLAQSFEVAAPIDLVWRALIDIEHVAPCLPGAAITGANEDGSYQGSFTVKIGPTSASYTGRLEMLEIDEEAHRAMMHADGTDKRGQGGASATIVSKLTESAAGGTHVEVQTDYRITGRLARFGRGGMIEDISERLLTQFADRLAESLTVTASTDGHPDGASSAPTLPPVTEFAAPSEAPDVGKLATEALLARAARNWVQILVASTAAVLLFGGLRALRRRND